MLENELDNARLQVKEHDDRFTFSEKWMQILNQLIEESRQEMFKKFDNINE